VTSPQNIPGVILAGGLARRMGGGDKPLKTIGGRSILDRVIARIAQQCDGLVLNANGDAGRFKALGLPVVADSVEGFAGPLAGVLAGLDWAATHRPDAAALLSVPADCPFLPRDLLARLRQARIEQDAQLAIAASAGRSHPVIGLWPISLRDALRHALVADDIRKVGAFIARYRVATVEWSTAPLDPFFNANTPEDILEAERLAALDGDADSA
jgi:molybdopterin-guanine dinucleotide biosynthesis protein A